MLYVIALLVLAAGVLRAQPARVDTADTLRRAFQRLYNFDFPGAHAALDTYIQADPQHPLPHSVKGAAYLYSELYRLKVLELEFFTDDDQVVDRRNLTPDPAIRKAFVQEVALAEKAANTRLALNPYDRDGLFALCMSSGLAMDYAALIERRRFGSFPLAKRTQALANRLRALKPPVYDAYMTSGTIEYVVGSIPFFLRWLVRIDQIKGSKQAGIQELEIVARQGEYLGPLARVMLAVIHVREKRPQAARKLLESLSAEYPDNPLFRKELARLSPRHGNWKTTAAP